ncbi:type I polyketide synthase [Methylocystis sp.]|uniref:type I polyketide synthase n=1 Tax=Methylocystis sp. TaxID=1911079 RepID=UPI003DA3BD82
MVSHPESHIAIVGFAGRLPSAGAAVESIWPLLERGGTSIRRITADEAEDATLEGISPDNPNWVGVTADIPDAYLFDPRFFGMTRRDAELSDPQYRVLMKCASEALQHAGIDSHAFQGRIGVYVGATTSRYMLRLLADARLREMFGPDQIAFGNNPDYLASAISYRLNLTGPSLAIQTACSTSLVCVHAAVEALLADECDLALAGGVSIRVPQVTGYVFTEGGILSRDGHVRPFDARAGGTVIGNGAGIVVLQKHADAIANRSNIWGVILGSSVNNDGSGKAGFTAPSFEGQRDVVSAALATAGVNPETIGYVEAHGTGTMVGDPIELSALGEAFRQCGSHRTQYCSIGSIKANIGHLDAAAGIAGLLKLILMFKYRKLVPLAGFENANPMADFGSSPFFVTRSAAPWIPTVGFRRRATISSFGIGGTNVHMVLEEPPVPKPRASTNGLQVLPISADDESALETTRRALVEAISARPNFELDDIARTLQDGRPRKRKRWTAVVSSIERGVEDLSAALRIRGETDGSKLPKLLWAFSGQGTGHVESIPALFQTYSVFREACDACAESLSASAKDQLAAVLRNGKIDGPLGQQIVFTVQYALCQLWRSCNVHPDAVFGHSLGEYAAACEASVFDRDTALHLIAERQILMDGVPQGAMLAVYSSHSVVASVLPHNVDLACINGPDHCVVAGPEAAIERFSQKLTEIGLRNRRLATPGGFHSRLIDPAIEPFSAIVARSSRQENTIPFLSSVTGDWASPSELTAAEYWSMHLRAVVRCAPALSILAREGGWTVLEIGTDSTLCALAEASNILSTIPSLRSDGIASNASFLEAASALWRGGVEIRWSALRGESDARLVPLPPTASAQEHLLADIASQPVGGDRSSQREIDWECWFQVPVWVRKPRIERANLGFAGRKFLILADASPLREQIAAVIKGGAGIVHLTDGAAVGLNRKSERPVQSAPGTCIATPFDDAIRHLGGIPSDFVHIWTPGEPGDNTLECEFLKLATWLQHVARSAPAQPIRIHLVTTGADEVIPGDVAVPDHGLLAGLGAVTAQEFSDLEVQRLDLPRVPAPADIATLASLIRGGFRGPETAVRMGESWSLSFEPVEMPRRPSRFRSAGTYVIFGGLGQFGLLVAAHLKRAYGAKIVLVSRSSFPGRELWADLSRGAQTDPRISERIQRLIKLDATHGEIFIEQADIHDLASLQDLFLRVETTIGCVNGVIHAAGSVDLSAHVPLEEMDKSAVAAHFNSKVHGINVLEAALAGRNLEVCLFTSSLSPFIGGIGLAAYASAHAYMDRCVGRFRRLGMPCQTINWEGWLPPATKPVPSSAGSQLINLALTEAEIVSCLERIVAIPEISQVIVSRSGLADRRKDWKTTVKRERMPSKRSHTRTVLGDAREVLREIVEDLLGCKGIDDNQNLFELGATSLTMVQLVARARAQLSRELRLRTVFETPTIAAIAGAIDGQGRAAINLASLLEDIEAMSEVEVDRALAEIRANSTSNSEA